MSIQDIGASESSPSHSPEIAKPGTFTVPTKPCCGLLLGDFCDCQAFAAEARGVFARPIFWDLRNRKNAS